MAARRAPRYAVAGHSMGGAVALALAAAEPERVTRVAAVARWARRCRCRRRSTRCGPRGRAATAPARMLSPALPRPRARHRRGGRARATPRWPPATRAFAPLFPAPRERWVRDLTLDADALAAVRRARSCSSTAPHDRLTPIAVRRPPPARAAARRASPRARPLRPRARGRAPAGVPPRPRRLPGARCLSSQSSAAPTPSSSGPAWPPRPAASPPATAAASSPSPTRSSPRPDGYDAVLGSLHAAGLDVVEFTEAAIDVPDGHDRRRARGRPRGAP